MGPSIVRLMGVGSHGTAGKSPASMAGPALLLVVALLGAALPQALAQDEAVSFSIYEDSPRYTFVGDIPEAARLKEKLNATVIQNLEFSLIPGSNEYSKFFTIEKSSGILRTDSKIDRDTICPAQVTCFLELTISAHSQPNHLTVIKTNIKIEDSNDNAPRFAEEQITRYIPENTRVGASFSIPLAEDMDSPKYGVKEYRVLSGSAEFHLKVVNGTEGVTDMYLVLREAVDREQRDLYRIVIAAVDGGMPPNSGTLSVDIVIQDVNDHPPVFNNQTYMSHVREDAMAGTVVLRVAATDLDSGANGQVIYRFSSKSASDHGNLFELNNATGDLSVKGALDYEQTTQYALQVTAQDKDGEWLPAEAKVLVHIRDVNDNPPQISVSGLSSSRLVQIAESSPKGSYVAYISVEDPDSGDNGLFDCTMNSDTFAIEPLSEGEFKLMTKVELDREQVAEYRLPFSCTDKGQPALTSTSSVQVTVTDVNDNAPVFTLSSYTKILPENNRIGVIIATVSATDPDAGDNGKVTVSVVEGGQFVRLLPNGTLVATAVYDYEKMPEFVVKVRAADGAEPSREAVTDVRVILEDANDQPPIFVVPRYTFGVTENSPAETSVGQVMARDADSAPYNDFSYSLKDAEEMFQLFNIDGMTGELTTRTSFDRETVPGYSLIVMATDVNNPELSSSVTVSIYVMDDNDNAPVFSYPSGSNNTVNISNVTPMGETVTHVLAVDNMDVGDNAKVTYALSGAENVFTVDEYTGALHVNKDLKPYKNKRFHLRVVAEDGGSPARSAMASLYVNVNEDTPYTGLQVEGEETHNIAIVISVAVVTVVLVLVLVVAIVVILRRTSSDKMKKNQLRTLLAIQHSDSNLNSAGDVAYMEKGHDTSDSSTRSIKKDVSFSNEVDLRDETQPSPRYSEDMYAQVRKGNNEGVKSGKYSASPKKPTRLPTSGSHHPQSVHYGEPSYPSPSGSFPPAGQGWESHHAHKKQPYMQKEDNMSVNSQDSTNTDSGRGSNEDAESRPSSMETDSRQYPNQGDGGRHRRDSGAQGSARFKRQLSNVLQVQNEHITDNMAASPSVDQGYNYQHAHPRGSSRDMHRSHLANNANSPANTPLHHSPFTNSHQGNHGQNPHNSASERREQGGDVSSLSASYV